MLVLLILVGLTLCQSVFGMGILVFGTPILLLLEYSYQQALWTLLPVSFTVSSIQFVETGSLDQDYKKAFLIFSLPALFITLSYYLIWEPNFDIARVIGSVMLLFGILRCVSSKMIMRVKSFVRRHKNIAMVTMGAVHGISNMGGSLLSIISTCFFAEKFQLRGAVVFCYWYFGLIQLSLLMSLSFDSMNLTGIFFSPVAALIYIFMGKIGFRVIHQVFFNHLFTAFILLCASLLLLK
jgi:hypothetical protein